MFKRTDQGFPAGNVCFLDNHFARENGYCTDELIEIIQDVDRRLAHSRGRAPAFVVGLLITERAAEPRHSSTMTFANGWEAIL